MLIECPKCGVEYDDEHGLCPTVECKKRDIKGLSFPKEGGVLMYIWGYKYPMLGFPTKEVLDATANTKRAFVSTLRLFLKFRLFWLYAIFRRKKLLSNIFTWIEEVYGTDYVKKLEPIIQRNLLCKSAREIRRTLNLLYGEHRWIDCIVGWFEIDFAYRYRIQDIIAAVDKIEIQEHTGREIIMLFDIYTSREKNEVVFEKMKMLRKLVSILLIFSPRLKKELRRFFGELNIDEVRLTVNDLYWVGKIYDLLYKFDDQDWPELKGYSESLEKGWKEDEKPPKKETK